MNTAAMTAKPSPHETCPIAAVMVHVPDVHAGLLWYARAFPMAERKRVNDFELLAIGSVMLELVPADEKVTSGAAGSVVYWRVAEFEQALRHFQQVGAVLYRGPREIENGQRICQVRDPWGNCIGLRGPGGTTITALERSRE